ncbi:GreA/GreB family elongation factor [Mesonia sp. K7]|uniref:GreA/GreB family elongation factor n=1 Tax=Mesonia sp. K7 TaxID=2218606 RepID=UPI000DA887EF|nr:GreA/GreB family elongation factor [Mesonia sp. K7]PZD76702.1 transcription elongation factor GreAB [Mesonia sp. K7]
MKYKHLIIEKREYDLLKKLISEGQYQKDVSYKNSILKLKEELLNAKIVKKEELPDDVVRFNSMVTIQTPFLKKTYQLVSPSHSDLRENKISVLAPMGLALFGYSTNDEITWEFPSGENKIKIIDVTQQN